MLVQVGRKSSCLNPQNPPPRRLLQLTVPCPPSERQVGVGSRGSAAVSEAAAPCLQRRAAQAAVVSGSGC